MDLTIKAFVSFAVLFISNTVWSSEHATTFNRPRDVNEIISLEKIVAGSTEADKVIQYVDTNAVFADLLAPGWHVGRDDIYRVELQPQYATVKQLDFKMNDLNVATDGQFACVALQIHVSGTLNTGSPLSTTFRELDAFKKIKGRWQWIQQQVSYPVDTKTGLSVTDGPLPIRGPLKWTDNPLADPAEKPARAKHEIRSWLEHLTSVTDVDDLVTFFGPGQELIMYDTSIPGELRGVQELRERYGPTLSGIRSIHAQLPDLVVDSDGVLGALISRQNLTIEMKDGRTQSMSIRQSDCLRRVDGKWRAFFEMVSAPMDPKTQKAVMTSTDVSP